MKSTYKSILVVVLLVCSFAFTTALAQDSATNSVPSEELTQDFHIDKNGRTTIRQAKVMQIAGNTFYARYYIDLAFIRILIKTDNKTKFFRRYGDAIQVEQVGVGDMINIYGNIETGVDSLSIVATKIVDLSNQKEITGFNGIITGMGSTTGSFILTTPQNTQIILATNAGTQIKKGTRVLTPSVIRIGDKILDTTGTYDHSNKTLDSLVVVVYTDMKKYVERNFEGTLKEAIAGNSTTMIFSSEGVDYTVVLPGKADILTKKRKPISTQRFIAGDVVRVYGKIREVDEPIIDAEVVRNMNL